MKKLVLIFFILFTLSLRAQDNIISQEYYEGTIGGEIKISFYLKIYENGCPNVYAQAIYKYEKNTNNKWILLKSTFSIESGQFTFVEYFNTGILLLKKDENSLTGLWISPDGKKQLDVKLKKIKIDSERIEYLEEKLMNENYEANDC